MKRSNRAPLLGALCLVFVLLATANSGGYRYGISDQAFYEPAVQLQLHPEFFPRDRALLLSQAKLTGVDEALSGAARLTGLSLPTLFLALYLLSLLALCIGAWLLADVLQFSPWAATMFIGLLTLRHRIARTGANTLEGYMHPRQLAFGLGVIALACALKNRWRWTMGLWLAGALIHPTTAAWFAAFIIGGLLFERFVSLGAARILPALAVLLGVAYVAGPHVGARLHVPAQFFMDPTWTAVFADKDYIFVSQWPWWAWAFNLAYLPLLWLAYQRRVSTGAAAPNEGRLIAGATVLLALFAGSVLLSEARLAIAVQLQVSRVFWWMDLMFAAYAGWWLTTDPFVTKLAGVWAPRLAVAAIAITSFGRGVFTVGEGGPDRSLFRLSLPDDDWSRTMQWLRTQPSDWLVLADPDHAWKYGTSLRVAASRDVVLESVKDSAISLYDRTVAMRTAERTHALANFTAMSAADAKRVAAQYGASVMVTEAAQTLALPKLYANGTFVVYDLR